MKKFSAIVFLAALTLPLHADSFTLSPQASDGALNATPGIDTITGTTSRVGLSSSNAYGRAAIFVFALPKLAFGDRIASASLSLNLAGLSGSGFTFNGDLYGLGTSTSSAIIPADYFNGAYGTDPDALAFQQHFVIPTTPLGRVSANSTGNGAIAADLNAQYASGVTSGSYYFLRVNPDLTTLPDTIQGYNLSDTEDVAANRPQLSITTTKAPQLGRVLIEYWSHLSTGVTVASLLTDTNNFTNPPSFREYSTVMEIPKTLSAIPGGTTDTQFGDRLRGLFYPPTTGYYTFAIASDDCSALLLSSDGTAGHAVTIATVADYTNYQQWNKEPSQVSTPVYLTAGNAYYIESQHKQGSLGANMSIGYMPPGAGSIALMPATNVAPYDAGANFTTGASLQASISQARPRLMLSEASIDRLYAAVNVTGSTPAAWWASIQTQANSILSTSIIVPAAGTNFINSARVLQDRVYFLGLDYLLNSNATIKTNCLNKIYAELQSAACWGHSTTDNTTSPGDWNRWQLLDVPELTHAYAIAYDWCNGGWSSTQKTFILNTIVSNGFTPAFGNYTSVYMTGPGNWPIICNSGIMLGALAILGDETSSPQAPTLLNDLMPTLWNSTAMAEWGSDGGWPEAECYWCFPVRYLTTLFASLETTSATCFNFDRISGMSSMGAFELYEAGPLNLTYNFGDEYYDYFMAPDQGVSRGMQYLGLKYNQPVFSWRQQQTIAGNAPTYVWEPSGERQPSQSGQMPYPTDLIWYDSRAASASPAALDVPTSTYFANAGIILLRSAWNNANALFAGMKAGYNEGVTPYGSGHEQLEIGGFVFDALGVRWALDLGREDYSVSGTGDDNPADNPNRWQFYRERAEGNNTLDITPSLDGGQSLTANAPVTNFESDPGGLQQAIIDMTSAYSKSTGGSSTPVTGAKRGMRFVNGVAQVQDEVTGSSAVAINWFMHTGTSINIDPSGKFATLTPASGTSRLKVMVQSPSTGFTLTSMAAVPLGSSPNPAGQNPNTGVNKLRINVAASTSMTITVALCPYIQGNTPPTPPAVTALNSW